MKPVPKITGRDCELGNFILGDDYLGRSDGVASRRLLHEIAGAGGNASYSAYSTPRNDGTATLTCNARDWGRKYQSSNGGCFYIDLDHLELCLPETLDAFDHVAAWQAALLRVGAVRAAAQRRLDGGQRMVVLVNNSDGKGNAYGNHHSFMIGRDLFVALFERSLQHLLWLASFQVSSIIYTGAGKAGSENGAPDVDFQITQRGDFFERIVSSSTTWQRPIVNSRDESLTGAAGNLARLHCIFFDSKLCPIANLLTVGVMQVVLTMLESQRLDTDLILESPLDALRTWGHDPTLRSRVPCFNGQQLTAVEHQMFILEQAAAFVESGGCDPFVPNARRILATWGDVLAKLERRQFDQLTGSIDWITKQSLLRQALAEEPGLTWSSPAIKMLDHLYSSNDERGLFNSMARQNLIPQVVGSGHVERFLHEPPANTRAWTRAHLLRAVEDNGWVESIDWDRITVACWGPGLRPLTRRTLVMSNPLSYGRDDAGPAFDKATDVVDLIDRLARLHPQSPPLPSSEPDGDDGKPRALIPVHPAAPR